MAATTNIVHLRRLMAERFPAAHQPRRCPSEVVPTGVDALDQLLGGGWVRGELSELVGDGWGSGSAQVIHALLARTGTDGRFLVLIDGADSFDVDAPEEESLARLLWVRCRTAEEALKAADLVLRDRNLPLAVLDLKMNPVQELRRIPASAWHRLRRIAEHNATAFLVVSPYPIVGAVAVRVTARAALGMDALRGSPGDVIGLLHFERVRAASDRLRFASGTGDG